MSPFSTNHDFTAVIQRSLKGRTPLIAGIFLCSALGTVALANIPAAMSSAPTSVAGPVVPAEIAVPAAALSCDQQTWPYIDRNCAGDAGPASKKLVRVISPELSRTAERASSPVAAAMVVQNPVALAFATLSPPVTVPAQQFVLTSPTNHAEASPAPAARRAAEVKRPKAVIRVASRSDAPAVRQNVKPQVVAQGDTYQVRRVYLEERDVAHGLY